ncbi:hypothetical protein AHAS_Ahas19G0312100 [Arachis hypogaea]
MLMLKRIVIEPIMLLESIYNLQRLGLAYKFDADIKIKPFLLRISIETSTPCYSSCLSLTSTARFPCLPGWDVIAVNTLPDYMKLIFLALFNSVNGMIAFLISQNCAFRQEANWCNKNIIPPFHAYLQNATISSSSEALLAPCYFLLAQAIDDSITTNYLVRSSCTIFRLYNDRERVEEDEWRVYTTTASSFQRNSYQHGSSFTMHLPTW